MNPRIVSNAIDMPEHNRFCTCCMRSLKGRVAWLELDQRTNTYHDRGDVPPEKSQGFFPFGMSCARTKLKEASRA
jgi:hypothetical protein